MDMFQSLFGTSGTPQKELLNRPPEDSFWTLDGPKVTVLAAKNAILL
jgi:hypothetical protein